MTSNSSLRKVYFPRLAIRLATVLSGVVDFASLDKHRICASIFRMVANADYVMCPLQIHNKVITL